MFRYLPGGKFKPIGLASALFTGSSGEALVVDGCDCGNFGRNGVPLSDPPVEGIAGT